MPLRPASPVPIAVVAAALVFVVGVGGGSFAAGLITGADIKNGTIESNDVMNGSLQAQDLQSGLAPVVYTTTSVASAMLDDTRRKIATLSVPGGRYVVAATGTFFRDEEALALGECYIKSSRAAPTSSGDSAATIPADGLYATMSTQAVINTGASTVIRLRCLGSNSGINSVIMTATSVSAVHAQ